MRTTKLFGALHRKPHPRTGGKRQREEGPARRTSSRSFARVYTPIVHLRRRSPSRSSRSLLGMGAWADWILRGLTFLVVKLPLRPGHQRAAVVLRRHRRRLRSWASWLKGRTTSKRFPKWTPWCSTKPARSPTEPSNVAAIHAQPTASIPISVLLQWPHTPRRSPTTPSPVSVKRGLQRHDRPGPRPHRPPKNPAMAFPRRSTSMRLLAGNDRLMSAHGSALARLRARRHDRARRPSSGSYAGHIVIADVVKDDAEQAIRELHAAGVERRVMLTGDREAVARSRGDQAWSGRIPRAAAARRQGRAGGAHAGIPPSGKLGLRGRRHQRRTRAHPRRRGHRHGRYGVGRGHRGRRHRPYGRRAQPSIAQRHRRGAQVPCASCARTSCSPSA